MQTKKFPSYRNNLMVGSPVKPRIMPIIGRVFILLLILLSAAFIALTAFSNGLSWVYDFERKYSPLLSCPNFVLNAAGIYPNGPVCRMALQYNVPLASSLNQTGLWSPSAKSKSMGMCSPSSQISGEYIYCYWDRACDHLCTPVDTGGRCSDRSDLLNPALVTSMALIPQCLVVLGSSTVEMPCYYVSVDSFCDNSFSITPSNEMAIRGIIIATFLIVLIWFLAELLLRSVEIGIARENAIGASEQQESLPTKVKVLREMIEERWKREDDLVSVGSRPSVRSNSPSLFARSNVSGFSSPLHSGFVSSRGLMLPDIKERFSSGAWRRRLRQYKTLRLDKKNQFSSREFLRSFFLYLFYFALLVSTLYVVLAVSPQHINVSTGSILTVMQGQVSIWQIHSFLDVIVFADILLDFGLFFLAALCIKWPRAPLFSRHLQRKLNEFIAENSLEQNISELDSIDHSSLSEDTRSLSFVLKQSIAFDCCLLIACHESTLTKEKSENFVKTLKSALLIFPPGHVFICDNGNSSSPVDDTQLVAQSVHPDINYLYVPEGNKTFAFYWCNRYWIPTLVRANKVTNFSYCVIIDDDVPLPPDLHIPHEHLRQHPEVKAVHFPITAATPNNNPGLLVNFQDIEYKLAAVHKQFQSLMSRALCCHGAIALWERQAMEEVFYMHDTVFHGEDMYMGLCLLRKRDDSRIISAAQSIVPTYAPSTFPILFRQRVKSWELTSHRKTLTYLRELFNLTSFCHVPSLILKPYFLQELITILLDWLRVYLLCGLLLRDWLGLLLMTGVFASLMYIQVILFTFFVLRSRKELRPNTQSILLFPLYRFCGLLFRLCALCHNLLIYSHTRSAMKIGKREDEVRDIPPTPPCHLVDWFTVWTTNDKEAV